jgi:hypothetical protein
MTDADRKFAHRVQSTRKIEEFFRDRAWPRSDLDRAARRD